MCISTGINVLLDVRTRRETFYSVPKAFMVHQKSLWSLSNRFGHWRQTIISETNNTNNVSLGVSIQQQQLWWSRWVMTVFHVPMVSRSLLVPLGMFFFLVCALWFQCDSITHEASAGGELASLTPSSRISLTCSRLSACRISSSFTWRWREGGVKYQFVVDI